MITPDPIAAAVSRELSKWGRQLVAEQTVRHAVHALAFARDEWQQARSLGINQHGGRVRVAAWYVLSDLETWLSDCVAVWVAEARA